MRQIHQNKQIYIPSGSISWNLVVRYFPESNFKNKTNPSKQADLHSKWLLYSFIGWWQSRGKPIRARLQRRNSTFSSPKNFSQEGLSPQSISQYIEGYVLCVLADTLSWDIFLNPILRMRQIHQNEQTCDPSGFCTLLFSQGGLSP